MYTDVGVAAGVCVGVFRANRGEMTRKAGNGNRNGEEGPETTRDGGGGCILLFSADPKNSTDPLKGGTPVPRAPRPPPPTDMMGHVQLVFRGPLPPTPSASGISQRGLNDGW